MEVEIMYIRTVVVIGKKVHIVAVLNVHSFAYVR